MDLKNLFDNNRAWSIKMTQQDSRFFERLSGQQAPRYLWIGCSDSRVPANEIVGLLPGELFVHRNIANLVIHTDLNCLSVIQFAVDVLNVEHIMVVGHYGCGGVRATLEKRDVGLATNWLRHLADVSEKYQTELARMQTIEAKADHLCELNIVEQVRNVCEATVIQTAWAAGKKLAVHGWAYGLHDGLLRDLLAKPITSAADMLPDIARRLSR